METKKTFAQLRAEVMEVAHDFVTETTNRLKALGLDETEVYYNDTDEPLLLDCDGELGTNTKTFTDCDDLPTMLTLLEHRAEINAELDKHEAETIKRIFEVMP